MEKGKTLFLLFVIFGFLALATSILGFAGLWTALGINNFMHIFWGFELVITLGFGFSLLFWDS